MYSLVCITISFIKSVPLRRAYLEFMDLAYPLYFTVSERGYRGTRWLLQGHSKLKED